MKIYLRRSHAPLVINGAFSPKIDYIKILGDSKSQKTSKLHYLFKSTAIFLNGWIFPIGQSGEASRWRVCYQRGLPRLVFVGLVWYSLQFARI